MVGFEPDNPRLVVVESPPYSDAVFAVALVTLDQPVDRDGDRRQFAPDRAQRGQKRQGQQDGDRNGFPTEH